MFKFGIHACTINTLLNILKYIKIMHQFLKTGGKYCLVFKKKKLEFGVLSFGCSLFLINVFVPITFLCRNIRMKFLSRKNTKIHYWKMDRSYWKSAKRIKYQIFNVELKRQKTNGNICQTPWYLGKTLGFFSLAENIFDIKT